MEPLATPMSPATRNAAPQALVVVGAHQGFATRCIKTCEPSNQSQKYAPLVAGLKVCTNSCCPVCNSTGNGCCPTNSSECLSLGQQPCVRTSVAEFCVHGTLCFTALALWSFPHYRTSAGRWCDPMPFAPSLYTLQPCAITGHPARFAAPTERAMTMTRTRTPRSSAVPAVS